MGKQKKIVILGVLGVLGVLGGLGILVVKRKQASITPSPLVNPTPVPEEKMATYNDEAGFSFEYPEGLKIEDISGVNDYSVLDITSPDEEGKMAIRVVDTKLKEATGGGESREVDLGGMAGKQFQLENPRRLVTEAIDKGVLFHFESPLGTAGAYWNKIHNTIVSSFELTEQKASTGAGTSGRGETIYEEEEVVE